MAATSNTHRIVRAVTKPLGFFVVALFIVEAFLATVLVGSNLPAEQKYIGMWVGVGMFLLIVLVVALFIWFRPRHLMFDQIGHLVDSGHVNYGSNHRPITRETLRELPNTKESTT